VISHFASGSGSTPAVFPSLTEREREVLELIAAGKGNATIAHELLISLKTVRNHVSNVFTKLQVSDVLPRLSKPGKPASPTALREAPNRARAQGQAVDATMRAFRH
jgi:DNA-binding NarL/FixJ family response regulator